MRLSEMDRQDREDAKVRKAIYLRMLAARVRDLLVGALIAWGLADDGEFPLTFAYVFIAIEVLLLAVGFYKGIWRLIWYLLYERRAATSLIADMLETLEVPGDQRTLETDINGLIASEADGSRFDTPTLMRLSCAKGILYAYQDDTMKMWVGHPQALRQLMSSNYGVVEYLQRLGAVVSTEQSGGQ